MIQKLRIITRKSALALLQTDLVAKKINDLFSEISTEIIAVTSAGDANLNQPLSNFSQTGVFVKKLEEELIAGNADIAVHSLKDLPSPVAPTLTLAGYLPRIDYRDVLVSKLHPKIQEQSSQELLIGSSSPRRKAFLMSTFSRWRVESVRGNVETRISKLKTTLDGDGFDAIILSQAGLTHLEEKLNEVVPDQLHYYPLPTDIMTPAPGQGCIAVQCRENRPDLIELIGKINHRATQSLVEVEREIMERLGGGCHIPFGCYASYPDSADNPDHFQVQVMMQQEKSGKIFNKQYQNQLMNSKSLIDLIVQEMKSESLS